jgi:transposase
MDLFRGILTAIRLEATNGALDGASGSMQRIKWMTYGFRSKEVNYE